MSGMASSVGYGITCMRGESVTIASSIIASTAIFDAAICMRRVVTARVVISRNIADDRRAPVGRCAATRRAAGGSIFGEEAARPICNPKRAWPLVIVVKKAA